MTIANLTIAHLHQQYQSGALSAPALVNELYEKAASFEHKNIWIRRLAPEDVMAYVEALGEFDLVAKPLWGIPFAIKDNIDLKNIPTTAACEAFSFQPDDDAFVVAQLIKAGAIPMGKTNMDQFATGLVGVRSPEKWGECHNAFDDEYISGGSSSGSAVAVALGLVSFSLGTDTAGSGRVPAALNNIVGLKPSKGLLSTRGVVPACRTLDCVSIFATTTDDANAVFEVAAQFDSQDPFSLANIDTNKKNYGCMRASFIFGVPPESQLNFFGDEEAQTLYKNAIDKLVEIGGVKKELDFTPFFEAAKLLYAGPWVVERYIALKEIYQSSPDELLPVIKAIIESQKDATAEDTFNAFYQLQAYKQQADAQFNSVDLLVTPTAGTIYTRDQLRADPIQLNSNLGYYTNYMNLLDYSGLSLPAGFKNSGLPFGITLVGKKYADTQLLSLGNRWQQENNYPLGASQWALPKLTDKACGIQSKIQVAVCGAHLEGFPLNWQLTSRNGRLVEKTLTSQNYRFYALAGGPPFRPGLIRDSEQGGAIEVELWELPASQFGSFVAGIPQPLGIGKVELADGRWVVSFICEPIGIVGAEDITSLGGWRAYCKTK